MSRKVRRRFRKLIILIIIVLALVLSATPIKTKLTRRIYRKEYTEYVVKYSEQYGVEENLIYALIKAESNFNPNAVSHQNAKGLMQLMDSTAEDLAKKCKINLKDKDILDPDVNIQLGTQYLASLLNKYECVEVALAAYNAGSGNVDKWIKDGIIKADGSDIENIPYKETNTYVRKIMRDYKIYKQLRQTISPHLATLHPAPVILNVTRLIGVKIFIFMT